MALGVLVFVMFGGHFFKAFDLLANGISPVLLGRILLFLLPDMLRYALPLSFLLSIVLLFSRMSADNEIVALQAAGISVWQMLAPAWLISCALSVFCFMLSMYISPDSRYSSRQIQWDALLNNPLAMLEAGVPRNLSKNNLLLIGEKQGRLMQDLHLFEKDEENFVMKDAFAQKGIMLSDLQKKQGELLLKNITFSEYNLSDADEKKYVAPFLQAESLTLPLNFSSSLDQRPLQRRLKMMNAKMIFADMALHEEEGKSLSKHLVEFNYRLVLSLSPFAFLLIGLPFGIYNRRSETSTGLLICVVLALLFYAFLLLADSLREHATLHPELILWLPIILYQGIGILVLRKMSSL